MARKSLRNRRRRQKRNQNTRKRNKKQARKTIRRRKGGSNGTNHQPVQTNNTKFEDMYTTLKQSIFSNSQTVDESLTQSIQQIPEFEVESLDSYVSKTSETSQIYDTDLERLLNSQDNSFWYYDIEFMKMAVLKTPRIMQHLPNWFWDTSKYTLEQVPIRNGKNLITLFDPKHIQIILQFYDWLKRKIIIDVINTDVRVIYFMYINKYKGYCPYTHTQIYPKSQSDDAKCMRVYNGLEVQPDILPRYIRKYESEATGTLPEYPDPYYDNSTQDFDKFKLREQYGYRDVSIFFFENYNFLNIHTSHDKYIDDKDDYYRMKQYGSDINKASLLRFNADFIFEAYYKLCEQNNFIMNGTSMSKLGFQPKNLEEDIIVNWVKKFINCCILNTVYYMRFHWTGDQEDTYKRQTIRTLLHRKGKMWYKQILELNKKIPRNVATNFIKRLECANIR